MQSILEKLRTSQPVVMGILNVTPDSFSDGGLFNRQSTAVEHALAMEQAGADIIDIGGESTRPGAVPVSLDEEMDRVIPVIEAIRANSAIPISIDTSKPQVMREAIQAGASMVNDVNALQAEGALQVCAELAVPVCLMHKQGEPQTMQDNPVYQDVLQEIAAFLHQRIEQAIASGISEQHIMIDPGFGFGKTLQDNLTILANIDVFTCMDYPVLVGISRKSLFGALLDLPVEERLVSSVSAVVLAYTKGARLFRVHDVKETVDALKLCVADQQHWRNTD